MTDDGSLYRIDGRVYTYGELRDAIMAEVADLPPETWRDGKFDFDDYLIESVLVGTIRVVFHHLHTDQNNRTQHHHTAA